MCLFVGNLVVGKRGVLLGSSFPVTAVEELWCGVSGVVWGEVHSRVCHTGTHFGTCRVSKSHDTRDPYFLLPSTIYVYVYMYIYIEMMCTYCKQRINTCVGDVQYGWMERRWCYVRQTQRLVE